MKTTLTNIVTAFLMIVSLNSFSNPVLNLLKEKSSKVIITSYIEAITLGSDIYNKYLFCDNFQYSNTANNDSFNKKQYLKFLKDTKGSKFNCHTHYQILDETGKSCVAKATMKFDHFTRVDYITLNKTPEGWKVSKVITTYP